MNGTFRSYDIFDTTITRSVILPDHVHWAVGMALQEFGLYNGSQVGWRELRIQAERIARENRSGEEVSIVQIYEIISNSLQWNAATREAAVKIEIDTEFHLVNGVAKICQDVSSSRNCSEIVFVSDMYISASILRDFLKKCGINEANIFCSTDVGFTKKSGSLFRHVLGTLGASGCDISHIGDNRISDVVNARKAGVKATHFPDACPNRYELALWSGGRADYLGSVAAGSARVARVSSVPSDEIEAALWRVATGVAGPVLTGFVCWILADAHRRGLRKLFFLARDGEVLVKIAKLAAAWAGIEIDCST